MNPLPEETELARAREHIAALKRGLESVLFGQSQLIEFVIVALLARGNVLFEGLPGLGKTELVKGLASLLSLEFKRIQFTPDLLPGDVTGSPMLQEVGGERRFVFQPGPLFANLVLADEINRASPKTQSALLEAMQERRVTVMGESHELPSPFFVLATQNPIELEGTYPLPEAQLDRFLFKLNITRGPVAVMEKIIRQREIGVTPKINPVLSGKDFLSLCDISRRLYLPDIVVNYIARLVEGTHPQSSAASSGVRYGASPRAGLALAAAARARALVNGRPNASIEDVRTLAGPALAHRIVLDYGARMEGRSPDMVVGELLREIEVGEHPLPPTLERSGGERA